MAKDHDHDGVPLDSYPPAPPASRSDPSPNAIRTDYPSDEPTDDEELLHWAAGASGDTRPSDPAALRLLGDDGSPQTGSELSSSSKSSPAGTYTTDAGERSGSSGRTRRTRGTVGAAREFLDRNQGFLFIALSQAFFATINALVKILQERVAVPVWEIIALRMSVTWLGCILYMKWAKIEYPFLGPPGVRLLLCTRGVVGFGGLFGVYFSLKYLSLSDATVLTFLAPVLVGFLASVLLKEPYSRREICTGLASLGGVVLIAKPSFLFPESAQNAGVELGGVAVTPEQRATAVGVSMIGVFGAAGAYLCIRHIGTRANALHSIAYFSLYSVIVSCLYPFFFDAPPVFILDLQFFALITPVGILGFVAQAFLTMGLQREKAGRGTLAVYSNLLFAMILEKICFGRLPDAWSVVGSLIIVGGAVYVALDKGKASRQKLQGGEEGKVEAGGIELEEEVLPPSGRS